MMKRAILGVLGVVAVGLLVLAAIGAGGLTTAPRFLIGGGAFVLLIGVLDGFRTSGRATTTATPSTPASPTPTSLSQAAPTAAGPDLSRSAPPDPAARVLDVRELIDLRDSTQPTASSTNEPKVPALALAPSAPTSNQATLKTAPAATPAPAPAATPEADRASAATPSGELEPAPSAETVLVPRGGVVDDLIAAGLLHVAPGPISDHEAGLVIAHHLLRVTLSPEASAQLRPRLSLVKGEGARAAAETQRFATGR